MGWSYQHGHKLYIRRSAGERVRFYLDTEEVWAEDAASGAQVVALCGDQSKASWRPAILALHANTLDAFLQEPCLSNHEDATLVTEVFDHVSSQLTAYFVGTPLSAPCCGGWCGEECRRPHTLSAGRGGGANIRHERSAVIINVGQRCSNNYNCSTKLAVSPDTLLRKLRRSSPCDPSASRVIGVDDFAFRRRL